MQRPTRLGNAAVGMVFVMRGPPGQVCSVWLLPCCYIWAKQHSNNAALCTVRCLDSCCILFETQMPPPLPLVCWSATSTDPSGSTLVRMRMNSCVDGMLGEESSTCPMCLVDRCWNTVDELSQLWAACWSWPAASLEVSSTCSTTSAPSACVHDGPYGQQRFEITASLLVRQCKCTLCIARCSCGMQVDHAKIWHTYQVELLLESLLIRLALERSSNLNFCIVTRHRCSA